MPGRSKPHTFLSKALVVSFPRIPWGFMQVLSPGEPLHPVHVHLSSGLGVSPNKLLGKRAWQPKFTQTVRSNSPLVVPAGADVPMFLAYISWHSLWLMGLMAAEAEAGWSPPQTLGWFPGLACLGANCVVTLPAGLSQLSGLTRSCKHRVLDGNWVSSSRRAPRTLFGIWPYYEHLRMMGYDFSCLSMGQDHGMSAGMLCSA